MIAAARPDSSCSGREERAVHLEDVDREPAEVARATSSRCRSRPSPADAERLQLVQPRNGEVRVGHHHGLGDLEDERRRWEPARLERFAHVVDDRLRLQLLDREVDAHRRAAASAGTAGGGARPARQASWSTQRPIGTIRPVSSASGMKLSGGISPARRVHASAAAPRRRSRPCSSSRTTGW